MNQNIMFERIVENALDFLSRAIEEISEHPKYSVIHFHASMELFIKARLMAEHWSLVVAKRQEPDWERFMAGDFISVTLDEAASRLEKVARSGLSKREMNVFRDVARHRNKMVHFFHEAHAGGENDKLKQDIVRQLLRAWCFLHERLTVQWKDKFGNWSTEIKNVDKELRQLKQYLNVVFDNLKEEIEEGKRNGILFTKCHSCGYEALKHDCEGSVFYEFHCMVCELSGRFLQVECTYCGEPVYFLHDGYSTCENCDQKFEPGDLADILVDAGEALVAAMEGDSSGDPGNCCVCDGYHTVVKVKDTEYLCTNCLEVFEGLSCCGWCDEPNTGDMEHSYIVGCNQCDGRVGWDKDD